MAIFQKSNTNNGNKTNHNGNKTNHNGNKTQNGSKRPKLRYYEDSPSLGFSLGEVVGWKTPWHPARWWH